MVITNVRLREITRLQDLLEEIVKRLQDYIFKFASDIKMCTGICLGDIPFITVC